MFLFVRNRIVLAAFLFQAVFPAFLIARDVQRDERPVENLSDMLLVKSFVNLSKFDFSIAYMPQNNEWGKSTDEIKYTTNNPTNVGIRAAYKFIGLSFSSSLKDFVLDEERYGTTKFHDFQMNFYFKHFACDLFFQQYTGYYLENGDSLSVTNRSVTVRPDVRTRNIGLNFFYIFSDNFSFKAAFEQTERQNLWDWSFLVMISAHNFVISGNKTLIVPSEQVYYGNDAGFSGGRYRTAGISPGIGLTVPFGEMLFSIAVFAGAGIIHENYDSLSGVHDEIGIAYKSNLRTGFGYSGSHYFWGLTVVVDSYNSRMTGGGVSLTTFPAYADFYFGRRFGL